MSVTIYLTDHNGRKVAFFYRIDSERYNTAPNILWACRGHEYNGVCHSKEEAFEAFKAVLKDMKQKDKSLPVRKSCVVCDKDLHLRERETNKCSEHDFQ
jgi:hypothetical protein